jgi:Ulp1 family protease
MEASITFYARYIMGVQKHPAIKRSEKVFSTYIYTQLLAESIQTIVATLVLLKI